MSITSGTPAFVAVWSPTSVTLYDPITTQLFHGATLADVATNVPSGRELVVAISQRNTFIRTIPVPNVPKAELIKIISLKLVPLLPVGGQDYVSGFRIGVGIQGDPRVAIVGAVRADQLKAVDADVKRAGLTVRAVLPFAFASWLLAKERSLSECAVVVEAGDSLSIDIVRGGELRYTRSIPLPETDEEFQDEVDRTFRIAEMGPVPVLATGGVNVLADMTDPRPLVHQFSDASAIEKHLFSLEPLEKTLAREARIRRSVSGRAIAAAAVAVILGAYVALSTRTTLLKNAETLKFKLETEKKIKDDARTAIAKSDRIHDSAKVIDAAFNPAQKFTDVIEVLGGNSSPKSWFTGLTLERGKLVLIRGNAMDGKTVAEYVTELSQDKRFRGMRLVFANKATIGKKPVVQFAISGHVVGNLPLDEVPNGGRHV